MLSDKEMYARMKGWQGGKGDGTICGRGSTRHCTANIRAWLPDVVERYSIGSVVDAGAGDLHWVKSVKWDVDYMPFDLIPRKPEVKKADITTELLPECDAILCRMVLNHLDHARVQMALDNFEDVADYLLATHFAGPQVNKNREFTRMDLTQWLGEPLEMCQDGHEPRCYLALWQL